MQVYWIKSESEAIPAIVKRQGYLYTRIAIMIEGNRVSYDTVPKEQVIPRKVDAEIDRREQEEIRRREARKQLFG